MAGTWSSRLVEPPKAAWTTMALLMAASVMMSLPLIVIFVFLQSYLTRGFAASGVKG